MKGDMQGKTALERLEGFYLQLLPFQLKLLYYEVVFVNPSRYTRQFSISILVINDQNVPYPIFFSWCPFPPAVSPTVWGENRQGIGVSFKATVVWFASPLSFCATHCVFSLHVMLSGLPQIVSQQQRYLLCRRWHDLFPKKSAQALHQPEGTGSVPKLLS